MSVLNHLLAATDLSPSSLHAVDRGFMLAARMGARYTVVHALGLDALAQVRDLLGGDISGLSRDISDEARGALTLITSDPARNAGVRADVRIEPGLAAAAVPSLAVSTGADLILVGAHGKGFLQRLLLGSTASRLLRKSRCPVLMVKEPCRGPYRRALVAIDFSPGSELGLGLAREVAAGADLVLLHVFDVPFEGKLRIAGVSDDVVHRYRVQARERALRRLHGIAQAAGLAAAEYSARVMAGDATRQILSEEEKSDCDLVIMGKHGTNVTEELLLGSVTNRVLAESRSDVLVVVDRRTGNAVAG